MSERLGDWDLLAAAVATIALRNLERSSMLLPRLIADAVGEAEGDLARKEFNKRFSARMIAAAEHYLKRKGE